MKPQILEKNGLPKPLGMIMIVLIIGLACFIQLLFTQPVHAQKKPDLAQHTDLYIGFAPNYP